MIDDELDEEYEEKNDNNSNITKHTPPLRIILLDKTIEELKYRAVPFSESQNGIKPLKFIEGSSFYECYCNYLKGKSISVRLKLYLNSIGYSEHNTIYFTMGMIIGNVHLIEDLVGVFRIGEKEMSKSSMTSLVFTNKEKIIVRGGIPTEAWLRGRDLSGFNNKKSDKNKKNQETSKVPLEYSTLVYEEIRGISDLENSLQYHKQVSESGTFIKNNSEIAKTDVSIMFVANDYFKGNSLPTFLLNEIFSRLPKVFKEDEAIFDRYPFVIPHYQKTMGKIKYIGKGTKGIAIEDLDEVIWELRKKRCFINLDKYNLKDRERRIFYKGISSFVKLIYPESVAEKKVSDWVIEGVLEFVKHFSSFRPEKKVYYPFNEKSAKFIVEMLGFSIKKVEYILFHEERILIKNLDEDVFHKIALTGYGYEQNIKELRFFRENPNNISEISSFEEDEMHLIQKSQKLSSENIIWIIEKNRDSVEEDNEQILELIENEKFDLLPDNFYGTPEFSIKMAESEVKKIFKLNNPQVTKKNFVLVNGEIKFVNFSEFIKENNK